VFYFNRGSLDVGTEWQDKSIILLTNETQSISITYDKIPFGMVFKEFVEREINSLSRQLTNFKELSRQEMTLDGLDSVLTEFTWDSPKGQFHQLTAIIDVEEKLPLIITATVVGQMSPNQKETLLNTIKTFKAQHIENDR
jgi:hypothetical protein